MEDRIARVKANYSLVEVAHRLGLRTETRGGELYAICANPQHDDHHPSMHLATRGKHTGRFKCWSCNCSGDVVDLVSVALGLKIGDAISWLDGQNKAEPIKKTEPRVERDAPTLNEDLYPFAFQAYQERTDDAAMWLANRGLAPVMDLFFIGSTDARGFPTSLLPDKWDAESGRIYKHKNFLNRIVVPYLMPNGDVPYVNARALGDQKPKYLKAARPQGGSIPPYLMHMMLAMSDQIFVTEGEIDCLSLHAALPGVAACAIPGTQTLSVDDEVLFEGKDIILVMDNDEAGKKARAALEERLTPYTRSITQAYVHPDFNDVNEQLVKRGRKWNSGYWEAVRTEAVKRKVYRTV
ncbi:toprim domain-containing protein [Deinococcus cavernae]|uniref:Toprim domain-containing protein n=1 Tax=Deinococcus cavernae TaxID=2320857 RepID=A0A418VJ34_9DEIO|nr:toprim domain-containing protein [Deinococcus cavernae]RJF76144.1 toprim domain-containing protein [Deinococcus cavernae]RJF76183.1 toprim domain-containing protein [Deinococcus cavernae]